MKFNKRRKPCISVIVPFYNAENYIGKCLDSIIDGTKISYEIICVNDGSTDNGIEIVKKYCVSHNHIKFISFEKNRGLYMARLIGVKQASGKYIGFVDSDDYISEHFFDNLYHAARRYWSDIAVAEVVNVDSEGVKYIQTRCMEFPYLLNKHSKHDALYDLYWQQSGQCYHWHVVWNKLYKRRLWKKAIPVLEQQTEHLVMLEDFIFSSVVLAHVKSYTLARSARYYYISRPDASTTTSAEFEKIYSNILSMRMAFEFVKEFLKSDARLKRYMPFWEKWKQRYGRYWKRNIIFSKLSEEYKCVCIDALLKMTGGEIGDVLPEDEFYYDKAEIIE